jgi:hypothetical protein
VLFFYKKCTRKFQKKEMFFFRVSIFFLNFFSKSKRKISKKKKKSTKHPKSLFVFYRFLLHSRVLAFSRYREANQKKSEEKRKRVSKKSVFAWTVLKNNPYK